MQRPDSEGEPIILKVRVDDGRALDGRQERDCFVHARTRLKHELLAGCDRRYEHRDGTRGMVLALGGLYDESDAAVVGVFKLALR